MTNELRQSLQDFTDESAHALPSQEGRQFAAMITRTVNRLIEALEQGRNADAKLEMGTFTWQVTDTEVNIPPSLARVSKVVEKVKRSLA